MILRTVTGLAACVLLLGATVAQDPQPPAAATPEEVAFNKIFDEWRKVAERMQQLEIAFKQSKGEKREAARHAYSAKLDESNAMLERMLPALEAAFVAQPDNRDLVDLVGVMTTKSFDADRFEDALRLCKLLETHGFAKPSVFNLAGQAALELSQLDEAEKYLQMAAKENGLDPRGQRLLETMSQRRAVVEAENARRAAEATADDLPRVLFETTRGNFVVELFLDDVANTVTSFLVLVADGFYDGLAFYRVVPGFGASAGAPKDDAIGGPGYETLIEGSESNWRPHLQGTLSMIPLTQKTNGSQFFISLRPSSTERLNGKQTVFGRVVEGMPVVERLHKVDIKSGDSMLDPDRIIKASILRKRAQAYRLVTTVDLAQEKQNEGIVLFTQKKYEESCVLFREGIKLSPISHGIHFNLAASLLNMRKFDEAEEELNETLRLNPRHGKAHYFLGLLEEARGQKERALGHFQQCVRFEPRYTPARDAIRRMLGT